MKDDTQKKLSVESTVQLDTTQKNYPLGIGVIILREDFPKENIILYNSNRSNWKLLNINKLEGNEVEPYALDTENSLLVFRCLGKTGNLYKVIVNESTQLIKFIKVNDKNFHFETWGNHIPTVFSVNFNKKQNPIKKQPFDQSNNIPFAEDQFYHPIVVKGDWLKIKDDNNNEGWVKWKNSENQMIITLYYTA